MCTCVCLCMCLFNPLFDSMLNVDASFRLPNPPCRCGLQSLNSVPRAFDCLTHLSLSLADAPCLPRPLLLLLLPPLCVFCAIAPHLGLLCRLCVPSIYEIRGCVRPCSDLNSHSDFLSCQVIFVLSRPSLSFSSSQLPPSFIPSLLVLRF